MLDFGEGDFVFLRKRLGWKSGVLFFFKGENVEGFKKDILMLGKFLISGDDSGNELVRVCLF